MEHSVVLDGDQPAAQMLPALSSSKEKIVCPLSSSYWTTLLLAVFRLTRPLEVPSHKVPSRPATKLRIWMDGRDSSIGHSTSFTPSKRTSPNSVPSQRKPS